MGTLKLMSHEAIGLGTDAVQGGCVAYGEPPVVGGPGGCPRALGGPERATDP